MICVVVTPGIYAQAKDWNVGDRAESTAIWSEIWLTFMYNWQCAIR